jgi:ParB-like nuclease domain
VCFARGTEGSNPASSSKESANHRSSVGRASRVARTQGRPTIGWEKTPLGVCYTGLGSRKAPGPLAGTRTYRLVTRADLARELPAWQSVGTVKGVGELGLAVIVGEAGDIGGYATPAKLWKRLGLAVFDGRRQGNPGADATAEDWILHDYNRQRRAEVWAFLSDVMFWAQWRGARDEHGKDPKKTDKPVAVAAHAIGPYGAVYAERKAWNLARGWVPAHADADARRVMSKRFLRDLWIAWGRRRATSDLLQPNATRNARTHSEAQVAQIAGSIREFGFTNPLPVDGENGIIAGHGRVLAARKPRPKARAFRG